VSCEWASVRSSSTMVSAVSESRFPAARLRGSSFRRVRERPGDGDALLLAAAELARLT